MELVWPAGSFLHSYVSALQRGWSPDNLLGTAAAIQELKEIAADPARFVASLVDREAKGPPVMLPDGTAVPRLPGYRRWLWDGEFCGSIGFRWQPGTAELPPYVPATSASASCRGSAIAAMPGARLRQSRRRPSPGPAVRRAHDRSTEPGVAEGDRRQWRLAGRSLRSATLSDRALEAGIRARRGGRHGRVRRRCAERRRSGRR